ncbi:hypothetical protein [uncultured Psychrobacter sp.]|uniref:hypothetical protein n=1 Tax=uncultured Psychrobacter sp. TaxID=259303 RepID=UPI002602454F|nr:hypothetical protein [uncultured Psychrobacter sp.]
MGLAKFLEDNLERLYASLEESKRQVSTIHEDSSNQDWMFIKNKLSKELELVKAEYEKVLRIVTAPDFDEIVTMYEDNQSLEKRLENKQKVIDVLRRVVVECQSNIEGLEIERADLLNLSKEKDKEIKQANKLFNKISTQLEEVKGKMILAKNDSNHYENLFNNQILLNQQLTSEISHKNERIKSLSAVLDPDSDQLATLSVKDNEILRLNNQLLVLDEWCEMLEAELGMQGERPIHVTVDQRIAESKKRRPIPLSLYYSLGLEKSELEKTLIQKDQLIASTNEEVNRLHEVISRGQNHIRIQDKKIDALSFQLNQLQNKLIDFEAENKALAQKQNDITKIGKIIHRKAADNSLAKKPVTIKPNPTVKTSRRPSKPKSVQIPSSRKDSEAQYFEYLKKVKKS